MKKRTTVLVFLFATSVFAQKTFDLKNVSKYFDVKVEVAKCEGGFCEGKATFSFYKKHGSKPYQVIKLADTQMWLDKAGNAQANYTLLYDEQSVVNVGDFNFDGQDDIAICDGHHASYGMPSYRVYLSSHGKFVYSAPFSRLGQVNLGMFGVDKKKRTLETFNKSGCCWHIVERYSVLNNRPVKVFEEVQDATIPNASRMTITTKTLVGGRWKKSIRYEELPSESE